MGIYGSYAKKLMEAKQYEAAENISNEELQNAIFECYSSAIDILSEADQEEVVEEGANIEMTKIWRESKKENKEYLKNYKKFLKEKDFKKAAAELDKVTKNLEKAKKEIKDVDQTVGSAICGYFAEYIIDLFQLIIPFTVEGLGYGAMMLSIKDVIADAMNGNFEGLQTPDVIKKAAPGAVVGNIGAVWLTIKAIVVLIKDIKTWIKEFKADDKKLDAKHFNLYRNTLIRFMDEAIKKVDKLKDGVAKAKAKAKEEEKK